MVRGAWGFYNAVLYNGSFGTELSNLLQSNIIIKNPSYPNPYGNLSPLQFASTAPPNITIFNDDIRNPFASTETIGFSQQLGKNLAVHVDGVYEHATDGSLTVNINTPSPVTGLRPLPVVGPDQPDQPARRGKVQGALRATRPGLRQPGAVPGVLHARELHGQQHHHRPMPITRETTGDLAPPIGATRS